PSSDLGGQRHSFLADPLEDVPAAGVGQHNASGHVYTVDLDVIGSIGEIEVGRRARLDVVIAVRRHVDGVGEPLSSLGVRHHIAAAVSGVRGRNDVNAFSEPVGGRSG